MKKTIIRIKAYLLEEPPEGPRRDEKKQMWIRNKIITFVGHCEKGVVLFSHLD